MKTYGYYLILHILGLTGLIIAGVLAMLHGLWFCTIICGLTRKLGRQTAVKVGQAQHLKIVTVSLPI